MNALVAFIKKEMLESVRTYKLLILIIVFLLMGIISPVIAKVTPDIIDAIVPEGIEIKIPDPTAVDAWIQFFKNTSQIGLVVMIITFAGLMSNELSKGTLVNMLTKGLSRRTVILSKFISSTLQWTFAFILSAVTTLLYTNFLWPEGSVSNLFLALFGLWLFGIMMLSLIIMGGVLFKNLTTNMLATGGLFLIMLIINIFPDVKPYNPMTLFSGNMGLLVEKQAVSDFYSATIVTSIVLLITLSCSIIMFDRKEV